MGNFENNMYTYEFILIEILKDYCDFMFRQQI